ncbi:MAG: polyprenyl synthetase family protein, partial [Bacteroidales bacterium]|nr:polyprenyl synthetase family protein [Bacteroidales bacterium]
MLEPLYAPLRPALADVEHYIGRLTQSDFPLLEQVGQHLFNRKGKQLRPLLLLYTHRLFQPEAAIADEALRCAALIEILHTSSLVHAAV